MTQQYDNNNRGVLFTNDRKQTDSHPDMKGRLNVNGVDHWFSAWWKEPRNGGDQFLSLSLGKPVEGGQQAQRAPSARSGRPSRGGPPPRQQQGQQDESRGRQGGGFVEQDEDIPW